MTPVIALYLTVVGHQIVFTLTWALAAWRGLEARVTWIWTLGGLVATAGLLCVALRGQVAPWLGLALAKALLLGGMLLIRHGIQRFVGQRVQARAPLLFWLACAGLLLGLNAVDALRALTICGAVMQAAVLIDIGRLIVRHLSDEFGRLMARLTAAPFLVLGLLYAHRGWQQAVAADPVLRDLPTLTTAMSQSVAALLVNLALMTLVGARLMKQLRHRSDHDGLTGLLNRRRAEERLAEELERARRDGSALGLLSIDVDHFKHINDTLGHPAGDQVLVQMATILRGAVRQGDCVARVGGEEFWVLAPRAGHEGTRQLAERVLDAVRTQPCLIGSGAAVVSVPIRVSIGATVAANHTEPGDPLLKRLDAALYAAKHGGRDRMAWAGETAGAAEAEAEAPAI